jgi:hypothetical protein
MLSRCNYYVFLDLERVACRIWVCFGWVVVDEWRLFAVCRNEFNRKCNIKGTENTM